MTTCRTYTIEKAPTPGFTVTAGQYEGVGSFNTTLHVSYSAGAGQIVRIVNSDPITGDSCLPTDIPLDANGDAIVPYQVIGTHTIYVIKITGTGGENCCTSFSHTLCQYSNYITFTLAASELTSIDISSPTTSIISKDIIQFTAICKDQLTNTMTCPILKWNSSDSSVGTIDSSGLFTALDIAYQGTTDITASSGDVKSNISMVTVTPPTIPHYTGNIYFVSNPSNAQIMLAPTGQTPIYQNTNTPSTISDLPIGMYDYILKKTNYNDYISPQPVTVSTNQTTNVTANLIPAEGCILFISNPSNAQIWLAPSGQTLVDQGVTTPALICELSLGEHCYKLVLPGYEDKTGCTTLGVGQGNTITENLTHVPHVSQVSSITISPISTTINIGDTQQLIATCKDQNDNIITCPTVAWNSSNVNVGIIDQSTGIFLAIGEGTTVITAISGTISGIATVNVTPSVITPVQFGIIGNINDAALMLAGAMLLSVMMVKYQKVQIEQIPVL